MWESCTHWGKLAGGSPFSWRRHRTLMRGTQGPPADLLSPSPALLLTSPALLLALPSSCSASGSPYTEDVLSFQASSDLMLQAQGWGCFLGRGTCNYTILMVVTIVTTCSMQVQDKYLRLSYLTSRSPSVVTSHCPHFTDGNTRGHREEKRWRESPSLSDSRAQTHKSTLQCFLMRQLSKLH